MNKFLTLASTTVLLLGAFLIAGCSSGGSSGGVDGGGGGGSGTSGTTFDGNLDPAAIDATNVETIGKAAGESVQLADATTILPGAASISSSSTVDQINNIIFSAADTSNLPAALDLSEMFCDSGAVTSTDNTPGESGEFTLTYTFASCVLKETGGSITVNGISTIHYDNFNNFPNTGFSITYSNFTVFDSVNNEETTLNVAFSCSNFSDIFSCTFNSDFIGNDGVIHRVTNFDIAGNRTSGFNGSATFFHGTFGQVSLTIIDVTYGGCGIFPDGGTVNFSSSDDASSGTITFNGDCTVSGTWSNSGGSGSFPT